MSKEKDPHGTDPHAPGAKLDAGKPLAGILLDFGLALGAVADVGTAKAGAESHAWTGHIDAAYLDGVLAHLLEPDEVDAATGCLNVACAAWHMLCALEAELMGPEPEGSQPTWQTAKAPGRHCSCLLEFPRALTAVIDVGSFGANKYTRGGWQAVPNGQIRYRDAAMRHLLYRGRCIKIDADSKCLHYAQVAWNLLATLELSLRAKREAFRKVAPGVQVVLDNMAAAKPVALRPATVSTMTKVQHAVLDWATKDRGPRVTGAVPARRRKNTKTTKKASRS